MTVSAPQRAIWCLIHRLLRAGIPCCVVCASASMALSAPAESAVSLQIAPVEDTPPAASPELSYFSERSVSLELRLRGAAACPDIAAQLVQLSYRLEAELLRRRAFDCAELPGAAEAAPADFVFPFAVPKVDRVSRFEWRFIKCNGAGESCDVLLSLPFSAYPRDLLGPLKSWAAKHVLVVRDPLGELQDFLDENEIEFFERAAPQTLDMQVKTLLVERGAPIEASDYETYLTKGDVVLFREKTDTLPLIKSIEIGDRRLTTVELVLIPKLISGPAVQRVFLDILDLPRKEEPLR